MATSKKTFGLGTLGGLGTFGPGTLSGGTPLPRWITPGRCGCCSCTYFLDKFTRDDNDDLGGNWDEQLGAWAIENYRAKTTSSNARLICNVEGNDDEHVVSAALRGMGVGDQPRLISSKVIDEDTYWFFQMTYGETTVDLDLYQRTDGGDVHRGSTETIYNMKPGIPLALRIAFDGSKICGQYRRITDTIWTTAAQYDTLEITDSICGVGTGTVNNEVRVDDFRIERHGSLHPGCPHCLPQCGEWTMPDEMLVTLTGQSQPPELEYRAFKMLRDEGPIVLRRVRGIPCMYRAVLNNPWWTHIELGVSFNGGRLVLDSHFGFGPWGSSSPFWWTNTWSDTTDIGHLSGKTGWVANPYWALLLPPPGQPIHVYDWSVSALW